MKEVTQATFRIVTFQEITTEDMTKEDQWKALDISSTNNKTTTTEAIAARVDDIEQVIL